MTEEMFMQLYQEAERQLERVDAEIKPTKETQDNVPKT